MQSGFGTGRGEEWQQPYGKQRGRSPTVMTGSILEMPWDLGVFPERFMEVFEAIARVAFDSRQDVRHVMPLRIVRGGNSDSLSRLITGLAHRIQCMGSQATAQALYGSKQHFRRIPGPGKRVVIAVEGFNPAHGQLIHVPLSRRMDSCMALPYSTGPCSTFGQQTSLGQERHPLFLGCIPVRAQLLACGRNVQQPRIVLPPEIQRKSRDPAVARH